jgi:hypothetical protein
VADEKGLAEADLVLLPEDWDGELAPGVSSNLMFVVQLSDGEPVRLGKVERPRDARQVKESLEGGEPLQSTQVELQGGEVLDVRYSRQGVLWKTRGHHVLLPARREFESVGEVAAILSEPHQLLLASEPLPGPEAPITVPEKERRACPGPPPHRPIVPRGLKFCPNHPGVETEPI